MTTDPNASSGESLDHSTAAARTLVLMRHAKSDWGDATLADHDRPLNKRGLRDGSRMGRWLSGMETVPDVVLCSSSVRTRQSVGLMMAEWSSQPTVLYSEDLYLATPETILRRVRSDACDAARLLVVAHNPGMSQLVSLLSGESLEMPTAAIAVFDCAVTDWDQLSTSTSLNLLHYMRPKAL